MNPTLLPTPDRPTITVAHTRGRHHRKRDYSPLRTTLNAGIALVGAGAVVGATSLVPVGGVTGTWPIPLPRLAASVDASATVDINASVSAMLNGLAAGLDAALQGWDTAVNVGADLVVNLALAPVNLAVDLNTELAANLAGALSALGQLGGPLLATLVSGLISGTVDFTALLNTLIAGAGDAVTWTATLGALLADLFSTGGVALVGALDGILQALVGGTVVGLPSIDFADVAASLGAVINQVAVGLDAALLGWDTTVNLGADIVSNIALTAAAMGALGTGTIAAALSAALSALGPIGAPILPIVSVAASLIGAGFTRIGALVDWKAQLDAVLADALSTGGVAAVNAITTGLLGPLGTEPVGLPAVGNAEVTASVDALVNHVTVGLSGAVLGNTGTAANDPTPPPPASALTSTARPNTLTEPTSPTTTEIDSASVTTSADPIGDDATDTTSPTAKQVKPSAPGNLNVAGKLSSIATRSSAAVGIVGKALGGLGHAAAQSDGASSAGGEGTR